MLKPLKEFICDTCGEVINKPEEGWVEWLSFIEDDELKGKDFRICHHKSKCQKHARHQYCSDLPMTHFIGGEAVAHLTGMLDPKVNDGCTPIDMEQFIDFFRRFTLPYYEEARQYFPKAKEVNWFEDSKYINIYRPEKLSEFIRNFALEYQEDEDVRIY